MADVLSEVRKGMEQRLRELEPMVVEHAHVRAALEALKGAGTRTRRTVTTASKRGQASKDSAGATGRGRPRGSGARAQEALKHVHAHPGITIREMATRMKIKTNYLYRVLPQLEKDGKVTKRDKGYYPPDPLVTRAEREENQI
jgi:hypothetical protein